MFLLYFRQFGKAAKVFSGHSKANKLAGLDKQNFLKITPQEKLLQQKE